MRSVTCHPDRTHHAHGFCKPCYNRDYNRRHSRTREPICDGFLFRAWLKGQKLLHFHLRILGNGTDASWVIVRSRTALCEDETRCVILPVY